MPDQIAKVVVEIDVEAARRAQPPGTPTTDRAVVESVVSMLQWKIAEKGPCPDGKWGGELYIGERRIAAWFCYPTGSDEAQGK